MVKGMKNLLSNLRKIFLLTIMVGIFAMPIKANSISVSPPRLEFTSTPGGYFEGNIEVYGAKEKNIRVKTYFCDYEFDPVGNVVFFPDAGQVAGSATPWLKMEPEEFILPAGTKKLLKVWGRVPVGAPPGDYWSMFFVEFIPFSTVQTGGMRMSGRVGGSVTITVPGTIKTKGKISSFMLKYEQRGNKPGVSGKLLFLNEGDCILEPAGHLEIKDLQNKTVSKVLISPVKVFPGAKREIEIRQDLSLKPGQYIALVILDYGGAKLAGYQKIFEVN